MSNYMLKSAALLPVLLLAAHAATAQPTGLPAVAASAAKAHAAIAVCASCGTVQEVKEETRKGKGTLLGKAGGAVVGGLLGNQIGHGTGRTVATVGGAVGGAVVGNEIEKHARSTKVWVTTVKLKDGSVKTFEQAAKPTWTAGQVVKVNGNALETF